MVELLRVLVIDKLKSDAAARRVIIHGVEHRQHKDLNNRAENPHQPTRRRERIMKRFKSRGRLNAFFLPMTKSPTFSSAALTTALPQAPGPATPVLHNHPHRSAPFSP
jgi:transposase-like protein